MEDPAYNSGVTSQSVVDMIGDIGGALRGHKEYISVPVPLDSTAPTSYILFKGNIEAYPEEFDISRLNTQRSGNSRRSASYNLHHGLSHRPVEYNKNDKLMVQLSEMINSTSNDHDNIDDTVSQVDEEEKKVESSKASSKGGARRRGNISS